MRTINLSVSSVARSIKLKGHLVTLDISLDKNGRAGIVHKTKIRAWPVNGCVQPRADRFSFAVFFVIRDAVGMVSPRGYGKTGIKHRAKKRSRNLAQSPAEFRNRAIFFY